MKLTCVALVILVASTASADAQTTAFTYQGRLAEASPAAAGSLDFDFRLFDASHENQTGGTIDVAGHYSIGGVRVLAAPGIQNTFVGLGAGLQNATGQQNTFFGFEAGAANTTATRNSFFGSNAGNATIGSSNSFFGGSAGVNNTSGTANVFVGTAAGNGNTTGSDNVFVGAFTAHDSVTTASENVLVGASAGRTNRGSGNTFVGSDAGRDNALGTVNAFFGFGAGQNNVGGSSNTFIGAYAGGSSINGGGVTLIGANTDVAGDGFTYATAIGAGAVAPEGSSIALGRSAGQDSVYIYGVLRVGLSGSGSVDVCRNPTFFLSTCSSSLRYKQHVETYAGGLDVVRRLRPITFTWTSGGARDVGFAAEEVAAIDPLLATYTGEGEVEGVKYKQLTTVLVNAANEQQRLIEQQQKRMDEQQRQIDALRRLVCGQNPAAEFCSE